MNKGSNLKLLVLGGVDNAGKSTTVRYSTKYLGLTDDLVNKFLKQRNPPRPVMIDSRPVYIYCTSPQEVEGNNAQKCRQVFKKRIEGKEQNALIVIPFNLESKYEQGTEACLDELDGKGLKKAASFVFLNADFGGFISENDQARAKIDELKRRGYLIVGEIARTVNTAKDEQGKNFSVFVKDQLKS